MSRTHTIIVTLFVLVALLSAEDAAPWNRREGEASSKDGFVTVNGISLHYVDWGGQGPVMMPPSITLVVNWPAGLKK
jgi:hypothetical protein